MAEVIKEKYSPILYADPYAKKDKDELQVYATQIIDGNGWRIAKDGRSYCIGPVKIVDGMAVPREKEKSAENEIPENGVTDNDANLVVSHPPSVEKLVPKIQTIETTTRDIITHNKGNFGTSRGRPKKQFDEKEIIKLRGKNLNIREISARTGVPKSSVARILNGQKILV